MQNSEKRISGFERFVRNIPAIWAVHFLWLVCCLPVITAGASTTALIFALMQLGRGKAEFGKGGCATFKSMRENFFRSFKENFTMSTVLFVIYGAIITGLTLMLSYLHGAGSETDYAGLFRVVGWIAAALCGMSVLYIFGIQARFTNTLRDTILYSIAMPIRNLYTTIILAALIAGCVWLGIMYLPALIVFAAGGAGFVMYIFAVCYNRIFLRYIPESMRTEEENAAERKFAAGDERRQELKEKKKETVQSAGSGSKKKKSMAEIIEATSNEADS